MPSGGSFTPSRVSSTPSWTASVPSEAPSTSSGAAPDHSAFPRQFALTQRFSLGVPRRFSVSPDGRRVLFARTGGGSDPVSRLWRYEDGAERVIVDPLLLGGEPDSEGRLPERSGPPGAGA